MPSPPIIVLEIGPLDAAQNAYSLRYYSQETGGANWATTPAAGPELLSATLPDVTGRGWTPAKVLDSVKRENGVAPNVFREIGEYLNGLLEIGNAGALWKARRQASYGPAGRKMRTVLHIAPAELRALPWEMLYADGRKVFADVMNPAYRGITSANPAPAEALPLRILVVVGASDDDRQTIAWEKELEGVRRKLHRDPAVELEELIRPDRQDLTKFIEKFRPHVFHFIGHGEMTVQRPEPALIFWDKEQKNNRQWTASMMVEDFTDARWTPHLVLFNACRSANAHTSSYELARLLIENGACCVIGMQGDVRGDAAATFAEALYSAILQKMTIDEAMTKARAAVSKANGETRDWALPSLYVACAPQEAMPTAFAVNEAPLLMDFTNAFVELGDFIDRQNERRDLCWLFLGDQQQLAQKNLVIVHGPGQIGKSDLVRWCTRHLSLRGRNVHYVDLRKNGGEARRILRAIRFGDLNALGSVLGPLPPTHFAAFDRRLDALDRGKPDTAENPIGVLCETFVEALRALAAEEEILIILDHFELTIAGVNGTVDPTDFTSHLKPLLFDAVARGIPGLRMLLVMREEELRRDEGKKLADQAIKLPAIAAWDGDEFEWLARQYLIDALEDHRKDIEYLVAGHKGRVGGSLRPVELRDFGELVQKWLDLKR